ncbi:MAG TPA: type II toxin-antitoxin system VapC family toxin [Allosphingosinicella sp.]
MSEPLLLDTHAIIFWASDQSKLSRAAFAAIENGENEVYVSPVSAMEIATKVRIGRLEVGRPLASGFRRQMMERGFSELVLTIDHAELAGSFPSPHNDPWDRLLAAQAQIEGMTLVTNDARMGSFGVKTYW